MKVQISAQEIRKNIGTKLQNYCLECGMFYAPLSLEGNPHAVHYNLILPASQQEFETWVQRIRARDERVWGVLLDEHGTRGQPFCPSELVLEVLD